MATITARVPDKKKAQAKKLADELGVSLSTLVNMWINEFLRTKEVKVSLDDEIDDTHLEWYKDKEMIDFEGVDAREVLKFLDTQLQQHAAVDEIPSQAST